MLYSDIKSNVTSILNRRDLTPTQLQTFIGMAIQRIQRNLRVPSMEAKVSFDMNGTDGIVPVPSDLLELISITFNDNVNRVKLKRTDQQTAIRLSVYPGIPQSFYRDGGSFLIGPYPAAGTKCLITYYRDASSLLVDGDYNWMTDVAPDLLIYGALSFAADYFLDERKALFEQRFLQIMDELQQMAHQDELEGASISPAYSPDYDFGYTYGYY